MSKIISLVTLILAVSIVSASVGPAVVDIARSAPPNVYPWVQESHFFQRLPTARTPVVIVGPHYPTIIRYPSVYHPSFLPPFSYYGGVYPTAAYPGTPFPGTVYPFVRSPAYSPGVYPFVR